MQPRRTPARSGSAPTIRGLAAALLVVSSSAIVAATSTAAASAADRSAARTAPVPVLKLTQHSIDLSPNGDRSGDKARVGFKLTTPAKVTVKVLRGQRANQRVVVGPERLGRLRPGRHTWTWDGRKDNGRIARDGRYQLKVKARLANGTVKVAGDLVRVDTVYEPAPVRVTDNTVYPRTTRVHDLVLVRYFLGAGNQWNDFIHRGTGRIESAAGEVVDEWKIYFPGPDVPNADKKGYGLPHEFDGRDAAGQPLPAGTYWIQLRGSDRAGNRGRSPRFPVTVSGVPLVEASGTATVTPAETGRLSPFGSQRNRCGAIDPSPTYPDGFSYRSIPLEECSYAENDHPRDPAWSAVWSGHGIAPDIVAPRGILTQRVAMRGRPTVDGETDVATLTIDSVAGAWARTAEVAGETVTTTPTMVHPFRAVDYGQTPRSSMSWNVQTANGNSYDAASFTVDYTYLTPQQ